MTRIMSLDDDIAAWAATVRLPDLSADRRDAETSPCGHAAA
jgi:hypothetical protein